MMDWQVGDLALCVNTSRIECSCGCAEFTGGNCPPKGSVREVRSVCFEPWAFAPDCCGEFPRYLTFTDGSEALTVRCRKITPPEADAFDREVIELMRGEPIEVQP